VRANLLHPLNVVTELSIKVLRKHLGVLARLEILLPVEKPKRDFELAGVLNDGHQLFDFIGSQLSSPLVHVNLSLFADEVRKTTSETLDFCEAEDNVPLALNIGVEDTQDVLELSSLHQRHRPANWEQREQV